MYKIPWKHYQEYKYTQNNVTFLLKLPLEIIQSNAPNKAYKHDLIILTKDEFEKIVPGVWNSFESSINDSYYPPGMPYSDDYKLSQIFIDLKKAYPPLTFFASSTKFYNYFPKEYYIAQGLGLEPLSNSWIDRAIFPTTDYGNINEGNEIFELGDNKYYNLYATYKSTAIRNCVYCFVYDNDKNNLYIIALLSETTEQPNEYSIPSLAGDGMYWNLGSNGLFRRLLSSSGGDMSTYIKEGIISGDFPNVSYTPPSPYDPAGPSTSGGGDGSFDNKSDPVDFTELPSLSIVDSGFAGLFKPTLSQLNALANYLWNEDIDINQLRKLVANPLDLLISLTIMPVDPPTAGSEEIKVGFWNTHISINKIENQYMAIDFGSVEVKEYYGNALDYSPYTKISIYLPYIGLKQLNTDDVMKKTLALRYNVDLFTGACVAEIKAGESVLYTFTGNIANQIPLNAESFNSFLSGLIQAAASVGVAIASHGTSVATQGAAEAGEATAMAARGAQTASNLASMNAALTSAGAVATSKPDILHSGSMTANNGYLSGKTPYLIYEVPRACIPENYQTFVGYPSNITKVLSEVTGFTVVDSIHLENIPATDSELTEIERLLRGGVIL